MTLLARVALVLSFGTLAACGGGGGGGGPSAPPSPSNLLTAADVEKVIAQAVAQAQAQNAKATIAVVDRVGNVLGVFQMTGAPATTTITSGTGAQGGLEGAVVPSTLAAISMAVTGAYLSSAGNAFSTRTASQIIQDHFNPNENRQPGGPLFGVQFSQLACGDLIRHPVDGSVGPKPAPLGLAAEPGGLPLYKNGAVVGGIGVMATTTYSLDLDILDVDSNPNELIASAGTAGFGAPTSIRADHITADGRSLRFTDQEASVANPPSFASIDGSAGRLALPIPGYWGGSIVAGTAFGTPASGYRADTNPAFAGLRAFILVDANDANRYPVRGSDDGLLSTADVTQILKSAITVANRARAQIRQPNGSPAEVTITVVDRAGTVLGLIRTPDAPVFGTDVALQKARTAAFFSSVDAGQVLAGIPAVAKYVPALRAFLGDPTALANGIAYSNRGLGNLARPYFPDGITGDNAGPLSVAPPNWSVFNVGIQLDLVAAGVLAALPPATPPPPSSCAATPRLANGMQIFPGSVPIYRGNQLAGAIGISGDGIDQDDMVAFLGLANAGAALGNGVANAPAALRSDTIEPQGTGTRLRYVNCPQAPFNDSTDQNVCAGI